MQKKSEKKNNIKRHTMFILNAAQGFITFAFLLRFATFFPSFFKYSFLIQIRFIPTISILEKYNVRYSLDNIFFFFSVQCLCFSRSASLGRLLLRFCSR